MSQVSTSFADSTYSSSNKPSVTTLKADIQALETAHNETDTNAIRKDGTVAMAADFSMGGNQITNLGAPGSANDVASIGSVYPIGSVYLSVVSTNPATLLGFGTWSQIAQGQMLIGQKAADTDFDTAEETGGAKTVTLTSTELPAHTHTYSGTTSGQSQTHTHSIPFGASNNSGTGGAGPDAGSATSGNASVDHTHTYSGTTASTGTGSAFSIMNPYFVIYAWKRTA